MGGKDITIALIILSIALYYAIAWQVECEKRAELKFPSDYYGEE